MSLRSKFVDALLWIENKYKILDGADDGRYLFLAKSWYTPGSSASNNTISITSKSYLAEASMDISVDGYTPIAVIGYGTSNSDSQDPYGSNSGNITPAYTTWVHPYKLYLSDNNLYYAITNTASSTAKFVFYVTILYIRNDFSTSIPNITDLILPSATDEDDGNGEN